MKHSIVRLLILVAIFGITGRISTQAKTRPVSEIDSVTVSNLQKHSLSFCPVGVAFGIFSANYEYLLQSKHGLVFRADYEHIPDTYTTAHIESYGYAFTANYRHHFTGAMDSPFVGVFSRYRTYLGEGKQDNTPFSFKRIDWSYGIMSGKKWAWKTGFTATFAIGYGFTVDRRKVDHSTPEIEAAIDEFEKEYDFMSPFIGELSIGYSF